MISDQFVLKMLLVLGFFEIFTMDILYFLQRMSDIREPIIDSLLYNMAKLLQINKITFEKSENLEKYSKPG